VYIITSFCQTRFHDFFQEDTLNSPEYIQTSLAAAMSLGFEAGSFKDPVRLTGLNLLLTYDEGCLGKCAYCGIAGGRMVRQKAGVPEVCLIIK
jgi:hypothetical protein